jgi:hypothetical protein
MRVLAIVPSLYDTSPGQRYRIEQWEPLLNERGVEITFEPFENEELHSLLYKRNRPEVATCYKATVASAQTSAIS